MAQTVEVYPKLGCITDSDPVGFAWTAAARTAVQARLQGIADAFPGVSVEGWHLHSADSAHVQSEEVYGIQTPKAVAIFTMPNNATHTHIEQAFVTDGFWAWAKNGVRNLLPPGVTVIYWQGRLGTTLGRTSVSGAGP